MPVTFGTNTNTRANVASRLRQGGRPNYNGKLETWVLSDTVAALHQHKVQSSTQIVAGEVVLSQRTG